MCGGLAAAGDKVRVWPRGSLLYFAVQLACWTFGNMGNQGIGNQYKISF